MTGRPESSFPFLMITACLFSWEQDGGCCQEPAQCSSPWSLMRGVVYSQISPGSQTCVVVGPLEEVADLDLSGYGSVLWFAPGVAPRWPADLGAEAENVIVQTVERLDEDQTLRVLEDLILRDALHLPSIFLTEGGQGGSAPLFLPVLDAVFAQFESHRGARQFRQVQGFPMQCNVLTNLPAYVRRRMPDSWAGALDGIPAFICGAGPSLDASVAKLAEIARHGVIFATDSALPALDKLGIQADFALAVDPRKTPARCLPSGARRPDRLIVATATLPAWRQTVAEERTCFLTGRQLTDDWLAENGVRKTAAGVTENCGTTAFELALHLGCRPLCLFGMDHAVDSQDATRTHHQHFADGPGEQAHLPPDRDLPKVPGNYQDEIATPLFRDWRVLDARCAGLPAGMVVNVIDRGARFRNTTLVRPADFSLDGRSETKTARLAQLAPAVSIPEPNARRLFATIRRMAGAVEPTIAGAREAFRLGQRGRVAALMVQAFSQKPFSQLMGNYCLKIVPYLRNPDKIGDIQWREFLAETGALIGLAKNAR